MRMKLGDYIRNVLDEISPFLYTGQRISFKVRISYDEDGNIIVGQEGEPIEFWVSLK